MAAGDSGSPVRVWSGEGRTLAPDVGLFMDGNGGAAGVLTHRTAVLGADLLVNGSVGFGTSIARVMDILGPEWELVSSPECPVSP